MRNDKVYETEIIMKQEGETTELINSKILLVPFNHIVHNLNILLERRKKGNISNSSTASIILALLDLIQAGVGGGVLSNISEALMWLFYNLEVSMICIWSAKIKTSTYRA